MIHHLCLLETKPEIAIEQIENMIVETRIRLLKIAEVSNLRTGKRIDPASSNFTLFYSFDIENLDKLRHAKDSPYYVQFERQILEPNVAKSQTIDFEMEPGKDVRYS